MAAAHVERRLAAVLAADVAGYSRLMAVDEAGTLVRMRALRKEMGEPLIAAHGGRIVKLAGDGVIVEFPSAVEAVRCAVAFQQGVAERERDVPPDRRIRFRIGLNLGDIVAEDDDVYGDGVNIAARLQELAEPGGIVVARNVWNQVKAKLDVVFAPLGERRLKNIPEPVAVFAVRFEGAPTQRRRVLSRPRPWLVASALVLALVVIGSAAWSVWPRLAPLVFDVMPDQSSLAVLPFDNLSADPEQAFLADGIAEDIITELARHPELVVMARNSSFSLKDQGLRAEEIASRLGVRYVLEGSVRRSAERLRINVQLVDGRTGSQVWAERFNPEAREIYEVQDRIVDTVAGRLASGIREREKVDALRRPPADLTVYELALRGLARKHRFNKEDYLAGRAELERAIELDPGYAPAHLYLGYLDAVDVQLRITGEKGLGDLDDAIASIRRAIHLDPNLPIAYQALGLALTAAGRMDEALAAARHSVELGPGDAENLILLSRAEGAAGDFGRAVELAERAFSLNPLAPVHYEYIRGRAYYGKGDNGRAAADFRACLSRRPTNSACRVFLVAALAAAGDLDAARAEVETLLKHAPTQNLANVRSTLAFPGAPAVTERLVGQLRAAGMPEGPAAAMN